MGTKKKRSKLFGNFFKTLSKENKDLKKIVKNSKDKLDEEYNTFIKRKEIERKNEKLKTRIKKINQKLNQIIFLKI